MTVEVEYRGSPETGEHLLEPEQTFQTLSESRTSDRLFCSSFRKDQRTQLVLVHQSRRSPEAGLVVAINGTLFCALARFPNSASLLKNLTSSTKKG